MSQAARYSGRAVARVEDDRLLRGDGRYLDDIDLPSQLHVAFVRSMEANARITSINVDAARTAAGVKLVLTGAELGPLNRPLPLLGPNPALIHPKTQRPFAVDRVTYVGETIAAVIADSRYLAEDAAGLVEVSYESLPAVVDLATADTVSQRVHDDVPGNLAGEIHDGIGDVEAAFAAAPFTERLHLSIERSLGSPIEPRGVLAQWDRRERRLRVWDSTQAPVAIKHGLCKMLNLSQEQVEVVAPDVGGGFGSKIMLFYPEELIVPFAARLLGRPVKWMEDRWEHFVSANQERGQIHDAEVAFDQEGRILGVRTTFVHDTGAYIPYGIAVPANTATHVLGQYRIKAYDVRGRILYTNKPAVSPYRGAGRPHAVFVMERLICAVARRLGIEANEVRSRNLIPTDELPYDVGLHIDAPVLYDSGDYVKGFQMARDLLQTSGFRAQQAEARKQGRYLGMGMGTYVEATGPARYESCRARVEESGHVVFNVAVPSQGQGHQTSLAQIAADALGASIDQVVIRGGDSSRVTDGIGAFGSRSLLLAGNAVAAAAIDLRRQLVGYAAELLDCAPGEIEMVDGCARVTGARDRQLTLGQLAALANPLGYPGEREGVPVGPAYGEAVARAKTRPAATPSFEARGYFEAGQQLYGSGVHGATVEVDHETGSVRILKYVVVHDCGVIINPAIVDGQIMGGVAQGIGGALLERLLFSVDGQPQTTSFMDFRLPTVDDVPEITLGALESRSPLNPLGVKGTGEAGVIPVSAVIAEAVEDALSPFDIRVTQMPIFPRDILALISERQSATARS